MQTKTFNTYRYSLKLLCINFTFLFCFFTLVSKKTVAQCGMSGTPTTYSVNTTISTNTTFTNDIIIASGATLEIIGGCLIQMAEGTKIIVEDDANLYLDNTTITSISGCKMWEGIKLSPDLSNQYGTGASCAIQSTAIQNANIGVDVRMGCNLSVLYSRFNANYIGINLGAGNAFNAINFTIAETQFVSTWNLISPYPGQLTNPKTKPLAGIFSNNIGTLDITPFTLPSVVTFDNLNNGIVSLNENLFVNNALFKNIRNYDGYNPIYQGCGIYANGTGVEMIEVQGLGNNVSFTLPYTFHFCDIAINFKGMYSHIYDCTAYEVTNGIAGTWLVGNCTIENNSIDCTNDGIRLLAIDKVSYMWCCNNKIQLRLPTGLFPGTGTAIFVNSMLPISGDVNICHNPIYIFDGASGIVTNNISGTSLTNANRLKLTSNTITIYDLKQNVLGYAFNNCDYMTAICNTCTTNITAPPYKHEAYNITDCYSSLYMCNKMYNTHFGVRFHGDNNQTIFKENEFNAHDIGLKYEVGSLTGPQYLMGNKWFQTCAVIDAECLANISLNRYDYHNPPNLYVPTNINPALGWFFSHPNSNSDQCFNIVQGGGCNILLALNDTIDADEITYKVAQNVPVTNLYENTMLDKEKDKLYAEIKDSIIQTDTSVVLSDFYFNNLNSKYNQQYNFRNTLNEHQAFLANVIDLKMQTFVMLKTHLSNIRSAFAAIDSNSTYIEIKQCMSTALPYCNNYKSLMLANAILDSTANSSLILQNQFLQTINTSLNVTDTYIANSKMINQIALEINTGNINSITNAQEQQINNLTFACPFIEGDAVFTAQSIYKLLHPDALFDNAFKCLQYGVNYKKGNTKAIELPWQNVVFENDFIHLNGLEITSDSKINIFDYIGRCLLKTNAEMNQIDISNLPLGFYLLYIQNGKGICLSYKFFKQ